MQVTYIEAFIFDKAQYRIKRGKIDVLLLVDYFNNNFSLQTAEPTDPELLEEIETIARDLLVRKHGINFAER